MLHWSAEHQALCLETRHLLELCPGWTVSHLGPHHESLTGDVAVLHWRFDSPTAHAQIPLGSCIGLRRCVALYRFSPFWVRPHFGSVQSAVPHETLWWMGELESDLHLMLVPLLHGQARHALQGGPQGLVVAVQTGDESVEVQGAAAVVVVVGRDPHAMATTAARVVSAFADPTRPLPLRHEKPEPDFINLLGWCTWDAFYKEVSAQGVMQGLAGFEAAGTQPRWLILDDGWHRREQGAHGEEALTGLEPHEGFGSSLRALCTSVRQRFGIRRIFAWHALLGYWGGVSARAFPQWPIRTVPRRFGPGILAHGPMWNEQPWGHAIQLPEVEGLTQLYAQWHPFLAEQGIDGVKVDAQGLLESVSHGHEGPHSRGQIALAREVKAALEASVEQHFEGRIIHCMACNQEGAYLNARTAVLRTSDDYFPERSESHGQHILVNAWAGLWFGQFLRPDWDMFQSAHPAASFHAAARAISGGPVLLSDRPGQHDADLLRRLAFSDGTVPRCEGVAQPSPSSLYVDPVADNTPLKIFNRCGPAAVVGVFHLGGPNGPQDVTPSAGDVPCLEPMREPFKVWLHRAARLWQPHLEEPPVLTLQPLEWELLTWAPVERGLAVFGLADVLNMAGAVAGREAAPSSVPGQAQSPAMERIHLRDGGTLLAWSAWPALHVTVGAGDDGTPAEFHWQADGLLRVKVPRQGPCVVLIQWPLRPPS